MTSANSVERRYPADRAHGGRDPVRAAGGRAPVQGEARRGGEERGGSRRHPPAARPGSSPAARRMAAARRAHCARVSSYSTSPSSTAAVMEVEGSHVRETDPLHHRPRAGVDGEGLGDDPVDSDVGETVAHEADTRDRPRPGRPADRGRGRAGVSTSRPTSPRTGLVYAPGRMQIGDCTPTRFMSADGGGSALARARAAGARRRRREAVRQPGSSALPRRRPKLAVRSPALYGPVTSFDAQNPGS